MGNTDNSKKLNNLYLSILIFFLIISFIISFKTGNKIYYLLNTNLSDNFGKSNTEIATWGFSVRIEY